MWHGVPRASPTGLEALANFMACNLASGQGPLRAALTCTRAYTVPLWSTSCMMGGFSIQHHAGCCASCWCDGSPHLSVAWSTAVHLVLRLFLACSNLHNSQPVLVCTCIQISLGVSQSLTGTHNLSAVQMLGELMLTHIRQLFESVLPPCLRFVRKTVKEIQPSLDTNLAQSCMRLFSSLLDEFRPSGAEEAPVPPKGMLNITCTCSQPVILHPDDLNTTDFP